MYTAIKKLVKKVFPKEFLSRNEFFFRKVAALPYLGNKYECNICRVKLNRFITLNNDLLCPACGSRSRTRQLWDYLNSNNLLQGSILHFSPSSSLNKAIASLESVNYTSTDFENEFQASENYDITNLPVENDRFDLIICFHILEHIVEDKEAMSEVYRALKPNGTILIQTPFKDGDIYENKNIRTEEEREREFGQKDHVRIYSLEGLVKRFRQVNQDAKIEIQQLEPKLENGMHEDIFIQAIKPLPAVNAST
ncbi:Methyltransferase domain-containing protein [Nonlabens sp. Hel1_33_55]|nr:Methyltransferase domain-containing protein [Nonlabens sp. Hel1_33_55]